MDWLSIATCFCEERLWNPNDFAILLDTFIILRLLFLSSKGGLEVEMQLFESLQVSSTFRDMQTLGCEILHHHVVPQKPDTYDKNVAVILKLRVWIRWMSECGSFPDLGPGL